LTKAYQVLLYGPYYCDLIYTGLPGMPKLGEEVYSQDFAIRPGGCFNPVLALHRLGVRIGWICDFGNDLFSQFVLEQVHAEGIDSSLFSIFPKPVRRVSAGLSFPHDRAFVSFADPDDLPPVVPIIERYQPNWLLLQHLHYAEKHIPMFTACKQNNVKIYMDCQSWPVTLETPGVEEAIRQVDIFAPNLAEALQLTGEVTVEKAIARLEQLSPCVVIKMGAEGAMASKAGVTHHVPAIAVEQVVDTIGAGDCFNAGFLFAQLQGEPIERCLMIGNICGGLSVTAAGGGAIPNLTQVITRLDNHSSGLR
jgi:sugar/nucleoside kinase (ribokinase family)